jgi:excisionase family DNA binding protein
MHKAISLSAELAEIRNAVEGARFLADELATGGLEDRKRELTPEGQPPLDKALYTAEEVALLLGCSTKAVYAKVSRGQFPGAFRVGRSLRFRGHELLPFILEGRAPSPRRSR